MENLKNKRSESFSYLSRYTGVPYYYDTEAERDVYGIGDNILKTATWVAHKVKETDNLDALALKYYANPSFWWIIAYYNDIQDPFIHLIDKYTILKIPNMNSIVFGPLRK